MQMLGTGLKEATGNGLPDNNSQAFHAQSLKAQETRATNSTGNKGQDIGVHFNKFIMYENKAKPNLQAKDYPMTEEVSTLLRYYSSAHSVVTTHDYKMQGHDVEKYIEAVGGYPPRPSTDPHDEYWGEFRFMCQMQLERRKGRMPTDPNIWTPPDLWKNWSAYDAAESIHDEFPGKLQALLLDWMIKHGGIKLDHDILPFCCRDDFIGTNVRLAALNTWAIGSK